MYGICERHIGVVEEAALTVLDLKCLKVFHYTWPMNCHWCFP